MARSKTLQTNATGQSSMPEIIDLTGDSDEDGGSRNQLYNTGSSSFVSAENGITNNISNAHRATVDGLDFVGVCLHINLFEHYSLHSMHRMLRTLNGNLVSEAKRESGPQVEPATMIIVVESIERGNVPIHIFPISTIKKVAID